jgi:hypothetical protein
MNRNNPYLYLATSADFGTVGDSLIGKCNKAAINPSATVTCHIKSYEPNASKT